MKFVSADSDLGTQSQFSTIVETRARVDDNGARVDLSLKLQRSL